MCQKNILTHMALFLFGAHTAPYASNFVGERRIESHMRRIFPPQKTDGARNSLIF